MFREMLKSLRETTKDHDIEIVAVIDDDPEADRIAELYEVDIVDYSPARRGALFGWNKGLELSTGKYLVPAGDDQLFHPLWLDYALQSHWEKLSDSGVVGMNDLAYNGNIQVATMWLFDRDYCREHMGGIFAPPCYRYLCVDLEWNEKAKMLGKYYWDERAIVEHLHSAHGKREYDEHDRWKDENAVNEVDTLVYNRRKAEGFPIEWEGII